MIEPLQRLSLSMQRVSFKRTWFPYMKALARFGGTLRMLSTKIIHGIVCSKRPPKGGTKNWERAASKSCRLLPIVLWHRGTGSRTIRWLVQPDRA